MTYTVGSVAAMAGITVRTLHHYHEIGLLEPSRRSESGYRLYSDADVSRLQELLFYRELGMGLHEIAAVLRDPQYDRQQALLQHHHLLQERRLRLERLIRAVEAALDADEKGIVMDAKDKLEVFGDFKPEEYEPEVDEKWGDGPAYAQSKRRTSKYRKEDWLNIKEEAAQNVQRFVALLRAGAEPGGVEAMDAAEEHRQHINRWFYDCPPRMHVGLGAMYTADPRFTEHYDQNEPGLAEFVRAAIEANAARQ